MLHITKRVTHGGAERYYYRRRGFPIVRLYGAPGEPEFNSQYELVHSRIEASNPKNFTGLKRLQVEARSLRKLTDEDQMQHVASRVARSVNSRAKSQYKVVSEIDTKWVLQTIKDQSGLCAVSHLPFSYERGLTTKDKRNPFAPSVDRIDCSKGYLKKNCRIVLLAVNVALGAWGDEAFFEVCRAVVKRIEGNAV